MSEWTRGSAILCSSNELRILLARFITKKEVEPLDLNKFKEEFKRLEKRVADKIKSYYKTICPNCGEQADVMYIFWVKKIKCLKYGESVPLFSSFRIASPKGKLHVVFCPNCKEIIETEKLSEEITCPNCEKAFTPSQGYARGKHYLCPSCGSKGEILRAVKREGKIPETEMYAIEYYCPKCNERGYKRAERYDHELYLKAKNEFEKNKDKLLFPRQKIPEGEKTREPLNYNYQYFYQMFNERQLLCLSMLLEEILKIEDENIKGFMILAFSDAINANNMFCRYEYKPCKLAPLFGPHAYWHYNMPVEDNLWGTKYGRGTFMSCVKKIIRAKEYLINPYERKKRRENYYRK
ncbi:MAG: hypothetical protein ABIM44_09360 [candidate division WOR-3 bacterium]